MRTLEYLSPTGISTYLKSVEEFYRQYLADKKSIRDEQTQPMAIGSAFDAYVKAYLHEALFGKNYDPKFDLTALFEAQVEPQHRDWALVNGEYVFEQYRQAGCLSDLMIELKQANGTPRFEFDLKGVIQGYREGVSKTIGKVTLLGKPDVHFITKHGNECILDFKVNGYCSNYHKSPMSHYISLRSAGRTNHGQHKKCLPFLINEMWVNRGCCLDDLDESWARQLSIYAWLTGSPVGSEFVTIIHQIVCSPNPGGLPTIRIAEHHNHVSKTFQLKTFNLAVDIWDSVNKGHVFRELSFEASVNKQKALDNPQPPMNVLGCIEANKEADSIFQGKKIRW